MTNPLVTPGMVQEYWGKPFTALQQLRVEADLDALYATLTGWLGKKLVETTITDERHVGIDEFEEVRFSWTPIKSMTGIKFESASNDLVTVYNDNYMDPIIARGQVYFVTYVTDAAEVTEALPLIKNIMILSVIGGSLAVPDAVKYAGVSSYSVEGTSISYRGANNQQNGQVGKIAVADLSALGYLRKRVMA